MDCGGCCVYGRAVWLGVGEGETQTKSGKRRKWGGRGGQLTDVGGMDFD